MAYHPSFRPNFSSIFYLKVASNNYAQPAAQTACEVRISVREFRDQGDKNVGELDIRRNALDTRIAS